MKIIVTGGSGMVGSAIKKIFPNADYPDRRELQKIFQNPLILENSIIIHAASKVGGVKFNLNNMADFYYENSQLNQNILHCAYLGKAKKVISLLSTCIYPDEKYIKYPLTEEQLHLGPPHESNYAYAYSKRMIDIMSKAYRKQYGSNFINIVPNNLYGENDNFDLENSHVIPALMRKIWEAKINNQSSIEVWGDGSPLREFTYSLDIARILLFLLENYNEPEPINIGNTEEYSIKEVVQILCELLEYDGKIEWNITKPNGQFRKPSSNKKFLELGWNQADYTPLKEGLKKTCEWFKINYPNVRGV